MFSSNCYFYEYHKDKNFIIFSLILFRWLGHLHGSFYREFNNAYYNYYIQFLHNYVVGFYREFLALILYNFWFCFN